MGIWAHRHLFTKDVDPKHRLSLGEGGTPCTNCSKLAKHMGMKYVYLKREDLNPTGSFKDRSLAYQISAHLQDGEKNFVISSSGNAAISAIGYCRKANCNLHVYISDKIPDDNALILDTKKGIGVVLGCAHRGVINILNRVAELTGNKKIHAVIGGLHLLFAGENKFHQVDPGNRQHHGRQR